jgi:hypothetical protein
VPSRRDSELAKSSSSVRSPSRSRPVVLWLIYLFFFQIADVQESRLKFAKEQKLADDYFVSPKANDGESKMDYSRRCAKMIREQFGFDERGPGGIDLVVDCSGAEVCVQTGIFALRHGGTLVNVSFDFLTNDDSNTITEPVSFRNLRRLEWELPKSTFQSTRSSSTKSRSRVVSGAFAFRNTFAGQYQSERAYE